MGEGEELGVGDGDFLVLFREVVEVRKLVEGDIPGLMSGLRGECTLGPANGVDVGLAC